MTISTLVPLPWLHPQLTAQVDPKSTCSYNSFTISLSLSLLVIIITFQIKIYIDTYVKYILQCHLMDQAVLIDNTQLKHIFIITTDWYTSHRHALREEERRRTLTLHSFHFLYIGGLDVRISTWLGPLERKNDTASKRESNLNIEQAMKGRWLMVVGLHDGSFSLSPSKIKWPTESLPDWTCAHAQNLWAIPATPL